MGGDGERRRPLHHVLAHDPASTLAQHCVHLAQHLTFHLKMDKVEILRRIDKVLQPLPNIKLKKNSSAR